MDYGGGLGITSFLLKEKFPDLHILYCDFKTSHQYKFCEFLMKKFGIAGIQMIDVDDFLKGPATHYDAILAMDCFEHIPDLNATVKNLTGRTNLLIHDSTFSVNEAQPQHVNAKGNVWFIDIMLKHNFFMPENDFRIFRRFRMIVENNSLAMAFYDITETIYD